MRGVPGARKQHNKSVIAVAISPAPSPAPSDQSRIELGGLPSRLLPHFSGPPGQCAPMNLPQHVVLLQRVAFASDRSPARAWESLKSWISVSVVLNPPVPGTMPGTWRALNKCLQIELYIKQASIPRHAGGGVCAGRGGRREGWLCVRVVGAAGRGTTQESEAWASRGLAVPDAVDSFRSSHSSARAPFSLLLLRARLLRLRHPRPARPRQGGAGKEEPEAAEAPGPRAAPGLEQRSPRGQVGTRAGTGQGTGSRGGRGRPGARRRGRGQPLVPAAASRPTEPPAGGKGRSVPAPRPGPSFPHRPGAPGSFPAARHPPRPPPASPRFPSPSTSRAPFRPTGSFRKGWSLCLAAWGEQGRGRS